MEKPASERFINAYCRIEEELRRLMGSANHEPFPSLVDHCARAHTGVFQYRDDLKEFGELRNAITHRRMGDRPIAEPHEEVVERIEKIADLLTRPPKIEERFIKKVEVCSVQDSLKHVLAQMTQGKFNQMPVYSGQKLAGLLTGDAISLWLGSQLAAGEYVDAGTRVKDLLHFTQDHDEFRVLSRDATVFDAIEAFQQAYRRGRRIKAVIITENGAEDKRPIGIITTLDIPNLYALLDPEPIGQARRK